MLLLSVLSTEGVALSIEKNDPAPTQTVQRTSVREKSTITAATSINSEQPATTDAATSRDTEQTSTIDATTSTKLKAYRKKSATKSSGYTAWKRHLPFWWRKVIIFCELAVYIMLGVILGQMLEVAGVVGYIAFITKPLLFLGDLPSIAGPPFILSLQSGAVANSMLVSARDEGEMSNRQLYTGVLVVSCLSLFAHLPTYILPLAVAFGSYAAWLFFSIRFGAILVEVLVVLLVSKFLVRHFTGDKFLVIPKAERLQQQEAKKRKGQGYFHKVWIRSRRTILRILLYTTPSFFGMALLEYFGFFTWLLDTVPGLFNYSFLPPEAAAIIPAQALNLYNGIITAGNFIDEDIITTFQAVIILLVGSIITSPIRTLKHALPTYIGILGPKPGVILAISAQILRVIFIGSAIAATIIFFK